MQALSRTRERLVALVVLGAILLTPPLLIVFNKSDRIFGVPTLYLYLFAVWAMLIALTALAVERGADGEDLDDNGHETRVSEAGQTRGGTDA